MCILESLRVQTPDRTRGSKEKGGGGKGINYIGRWIDGRADGWTTTRTRNQENKTENRINATNTAVNKKFSIRKERKKGGQN
jgi:hypothetical protein